MSQIPERFFHVSPSGELTRFANIDNVLYEEDDPVDDPSPYTVLPPGFPEDQLVIARRSELGRDIIPLDCWTNQVFWTGDEKLAKVVVASCKKAHEAGFNAARKDARDRLKPLVDFLADD